HLMRRPNPLLGRQVPPLDVGRQKAKIRFRVYFGSVCAHGKDAPAVRAEYRKENIIAERRPWRDCLARGQLPNLNPARLPPPFTRDGPLIGADNEHILAVAAELRVYHVSVVPNLHGPRALLQDRRDSLPMNRLALRLAGV